MADELDTGVTNVVEPGTTPAAPSGEQTTQAVTEGESTTPTDGAEAKTVPYTRFKEVNDKVREYEERISKIEQGYKDREVPPSNVTPPDPQAEAAKTILKQYGFMTADEVEAKIRQSKEDEAVQHELARLEQKYDGKNGLPKFERNKVVKFAIDRNLADPEVAYKTMFEAEYLNWHISQAMNKTKGVKTENSNGTGGQPAGPTNDDLTEAVKKGDEAAFDTMIKRTTMFQKFFKK